MHYFTWLESTVAFDNIKHFDNNFTLEYCVYSFHPPKFKFENVSVRNASKIVYSVYGLIFLRGRYCSRNVQRYLKNAGAMGGLQPSWDDSKVRQHIIPNMSLKCTENSSESL